MAFAIHTSPQIGLVLASNRDEALDRPTLPLHRWHTAAGTEVIGGRDVRDGGTWLGCTPAGRVAMLTNVREPFATLVPHARSRGELVTRWLDTATGDRTHTPSKTHHLGPSEQALAFANSLQATDHGGFNLVLGDLAHTHWVWLSNRADVVEAGLPAHVARLATRLPSGLLMAVLPPGVYGLSNAGLDTPWPKTQRLRETVTTALANMVPPVGAPEATWLAPVWQTLADRQVWPDAQLPTTGVPLAWERALSAIWVDVPPSDDAIACAGYGTRSSALLTAARAREGWGMCFEERTWRPADSAGVVRDCWGAVLS